MKIEELKEYLKNNLKIEIVYKWADDADTYEVSLLLEDKVISTDSELTPEYR